MEWLGVCLRGVTRSHKYVCSFIQFSHCFVKQQFQLLLSGSRRSYFKVIVKTSINKWGNFTTSSPSPSEYNTTHFWIWFISGEHLSIYKVQHKSPLTGNFRKKIMCYGEVIPSSNHFQYVYDQEILCKCAVHC